MKSIIRTSALAFAFGLATILTINANDLTNPNTAQTIKVGMYQTINTSTLNLMIAKNNLKCANVTFKDARGNVLTREFVSKKTENYRINYDLSALEDGKYFIEIKGENEKIVKEVNIGSKSQDNANAQSRVITLE